MNSLPPFLTAPSGSTLPVPRLLVVFAHPDDEVLAFGGRMDRLRASRLLCVTDGAPEDGADMAAHGFPSRQSYREARRGELDAALTLAGIPLSSADILTVEPDVPEGSSTIADQTAAFHLPELTQALRREMDRFQPDAVLTHPYEGGHPDHDSCAFAVQSALNLPGICTPLILEAPFYHARRRDDPGIQTGRFLPDPASQTAITRYDLSPLEQARKSALLACFRSQKETLAQFRGETELFRPAPLYDFTQPPHAGTLFYEAFPWGMSFSRFRELVQLAVHDLSEDRER